MSLTMTPLDGSRPPGTRHERLTVRGMMTLGIIAASLAIPAATAAQRPPTAQGAHHRGATPITLESADTAGVASFLTGFVAALNDLDMPRFAEHWAPEASAFMPFTAVPHRLDGREAVLAAFAGYFAAVKRERTGPPYLRVVPEQLVVRPLTPGTVLVTFHLQTTGGGMLGGAAGGAQLGRRTAVLVRGADGWRIVHFHASMMALPAAPARCISITNVPIHAAR